MATVKKVEERLTIVENSLMKIVEQLNLVQALETRIAECEKRCKNGISDDAMNDMSNQESRTTTQDVLSRVMVCELTTEERIGKVERQITEVEDKAVALGLRFEEFKSEFPTPAETRPASVCPGNEMSAVSKKRNSCMEILEKTKQSVLVVGDSLARGVGDKLKFQSDKVFERVSRGGAKIESINDEIVGLGDDSKRHLVIIAGTNNLESDSSAEMLAKYEKLLEDVRKVKHRQITVVGVVKRYDLKSSFESKRIVVNMRLREMCNKKSIKFLGYDPERGQLSRDKLHLNEEGQNEFASMIFRHCLPFLW